MRNEFWNTRTEGSTMMWQNIRSVAEALIADDLMLANAIMEVSRVKNRDKDEDRHISRLL